mgnify:CR=1 FL=1
MGIANAILKFIRENPASSSRAIHLAAGKGSFATTKREINALVKTGQLVAEGQSRATRYRISSTIKLFAPIDLASYFEKEIDDREIQGDFNFSLITDVLGNVDLFTPDEAATLAELQASTLLTPFTSSPVNCGPSEADLEPYIIFSTRDFIGEEIPVPGESGQYRCPDGSTPIEGSCEVPLCQITEVLPGSPCPDCQLGASAINVDYGQSVTLTWSTSNAVSVVMNNGIGPIPLNGSLTVTPAGNTTYNILVENASGDQKLCEIHITLNAIVQRCPCAFDDPLCFEPCNWTVSYDPKSKMWISFHDWMPTLMMPSYQNFYTIKGNQIWKHNDRWDSFCNYYGTNYPWEIEYPIVTPNQITTLRSFEYYLDVYKFYNDGKDFFHVLDENFDRAIIYNSEQISGTLRMRIKQKSNPLDILANPVIGPDYIEILYSKEENKYRFNTFWDITNDRGEFSGTKLPMWITECAGCKKYINPDYVDYNKSPLEHKKFRHYGNRVILRKNISGDNKMILKLTNVKNLNSPR